MEQKILQKALMLKQQSEEIEKQLDFIKEQILELERFSEGLKTLSESKEKEMLAPLGKGVYTKAERKDKRLFVEVGAGIMVRKTPMETRKIIEKQIGKFNLARIQLTEQLQEFVQEFRKLMQEVEGLKSGK